MKWYVRHVQIKTLQALHHAPPRKHQTSVITLIKNKKEELLVNLHSRQELKWQYSIFKGQ